LKNLSKAFKTNLKAFARRFKGCSKAFKMPLEGL
jgi:hypothetical protein